MKITALILSNNVQVKGGLVEYVPMHTEYVLNPAWKHEVFNGYGMGYYKCSYEPATNRTLYVLADKVIGIEYEEETP